MEATIAITNKWQVHIPKAVRKRIKLTKPGIARIKTEAGNIVITPQKSKILQMAGKYAKYARGKKVDLDNIRDYIDYSEA